EVVRRGHQPETEEDWRKARRRMAFVELLELQAAFVLARRHLAVERATPIPYRQDVIDAFKAGLEFELTHAQKRSIWDVYRDIGRALPMNRMLQGVRGRGQ